LAMAALCAYERLLDGRWRCPRCGDETSKARERAPNRICRRPPLGDRLALWLARWGLTKQRYAALRGRWRVVGGMNCVLVELARGERACLCAARQAWLNRRRQAFGKRPSG